MAGAKKPPTKKLFYEAVFKHSVEAIAILDCQGLIVEVNPAACKLFGATKKKLIGKSLDKVLKSPSNWQHLQGQGEIEIEQFEGQVKAVEYSQVRDLLPHYNLIVFRELNHVRLNALAQLNLHHQRVELFSEVTLKIRQSLQLSEILQTAVAEVQRILQADRVLIYQVFANGTGMRLKKPYYRSLSQFWG